LDKEKDPIRVRKHDPNDIAFLWVTLNRKRFFGQYD